MYEGTNFFKEKTSTIYVRTALFTEVAIKQQENTTNGLGALRKLVDESPLRKGVNVRLTIVD